MDSGGELNTKEVGNLGEDIACQYLIEKGCKIIERNYRNKFGEIDIIATDRKNIRFVEVKARESYGISSFLPEYNITPKKRDKLRRLCKFYVFEKKLPVDRGWQIDVIAVSIDKSTKSYKINHIENAIWETEY